MKILFLTNNEASKRLSNWLSDNAREDLEVFSERISKEMFLSEKPDFLISYNYKYIIKNEVLELFKDRAINLHISLLPWNRGVDPNLWSFLEDSPKGVSIHYIDRGIDTGPILVQKEVDYDNDDTLRTSYERLLNIIESLFKKNWKDIREGKLKAFNQTGIGSYHRLSDRKEYEHLLIKGWDTPVINLIAQAKKIPRA